MTEKKTTRKAAPAAPTLNPDVIAIVAAIINTKGVPAQAALEQAKFILGKAHELA